MDLGLAGSIAVVTGGSKGMGLAIAQTLAAEGASVAVMAPRQGSPGRGGGIAARCRRTRRRRDQRGHDRRRVDRERLRRGGRPLGDG